MKNDKVPARGSISEFYNPYNDLQEIAFKFTSNTNPNAWFTLHIRGSAIDTTGNGVAYYTSAWVEVNGDISFIYNNDCKREIKGYGLFSGKYNDVSGAGAEDYKFTNIWGTSFSNYAPASATALTTPVSNIIKFDAKTMAVYVNAHNTYVGSNQVANVLVRNVATNEGYTNNDPNRGVASINPEDFAGGYNVTATFVDVTANDTVGITSSEMSSYCWSVGRTYKQIANPYDRYVNLTLYSLNGQSLSYAVPAEQEIADFSNPRVCAPTAKALINKAVDLAPLFYDPTSGSNNMGNIGKVFISLNNGESFSEVDYNNGFNYTPSSYSTFLVKYSGFTDGFGYIAPDSIAKIIVQDDILPEIVLKDGLQLQTIFDWSSGGSARPTIDPSDVEIANKLDNKTYVIEIVEIKDPDGMVVNTTVLNYQKFGDYSITYKATDSFGNVNTLTRTVRVGDFSAPVIDANDINMYLGDRINLKQSIFDYSAVTLNITVKLNDQIIYSGDGKNDFIPDKAGVYSVTYTATDLSNQTAEKTVSLTVTDLSANTNDNNVNILNYVGYGVCGLGVAGFILFAVLVVIRRKKS